MQKVIVGLLLSCMAVQASHYTEELVKCGHYSTINERNKCRQEVTQKYKYEQEEIEVNVFTLPKIHREVGSFRDIFIDEDKDGVH